jgi:hypothetical protein
MLAGDYPARLEPVYAILAKQFSQRRLIELGDVPVAPLPEPNSDCNRASRAPSCPARLTDAVHPQSRAPRSARHHAQSSHSPTHWRVNDSRIAEAG